MERRTDYQKRLRALASALCHIVLMCASRERGQKRKHASLQMQPHESRTRASMCRSATASRLVRMFLPNSRTQKGISSSSLSSPGRFGRSKSNNGASVGCCLAQARASLRASRDIAARSRPRAKCSRWSLVSTNLNTQAINKPIGRPWFGFRPSFKVRFIRQTPWAPVPKHVQCAAKAFALRLKTK